MHRWRLNSGRLSVICITRARQSLTVSSSTHLGGAQRLRAERYFKYDGQHGQPKVHQRYDTLATEPSKAPTRLRGIGLGPQELPSELADPGGGNRLERQQCSVHSIHRQRIEAWSEGVAKCASQSSPSPERSRDGKTYGYRHSETRTEKGIKCPFSVHYARCNPPASGPSGSCKLRAARNDPTRSVAM